MAFPMRLQRVSRRLMSSRQSSGLFHPSIIESISSEQVGDLDTKEFRMFFNLNNDINNKISPWHDIPYAFVNGLRNDELCFNYINEIPRNDRAKMECTLDEKYNPIKQDIKKGNLRYFKYGDLPFNYGFISQTWEDPNIESQYNDIKGLMGDGDPIDVCEISETSLERGTIIPIKVLSVLGLIDEGETDWKIIGLRYDHEKINEINSISDADRILGTDYSGIILDWFRNYKVPDGKPQNNFSHNEEYRSNEMAIEIINECHKHWLDLINGKTKSEKVDLTSFTHSQLENLNQITTDMTQYPRYDV